MGFQRHDVAIVVSWETTDAFEEAVSVINTKWKTDDVFWAACDRKPIIVKAGPFVNGYVTWLFAYDGSKEGWAESEFGDELRDEFVRAAQDLLSYASVAVCTVGSDDNEYSISSKENWREREEG